MRRFFRCLFFILALSPALMFAAGIAYKVDYRGLNDSAALKTIKSISTLTTLKKHPPASISALRYRAEADIPDIIKVLHAHGYYDATVDLRIEETKGDVRVIMSMKPGPVYKLEEYKIDLHGAVCEPLTLENIGIELCKPAIGKVILSSELRVLEILSECGFPLAQIQNREVIADGDTKTIRILLDIDAGPISRFGEATIQGLKEVKPRYVQQKVDWLEGDIYDSRLVESTQKDLVDSGLFSSVLITRAGKLDDDGLLPMKIEVVESKHKSVNLGVSYQTVFGPGVTFGWENRNLWGMGRRLNLQGDITRISHTGSATLLVPDFRRLDQDLVFQAVAMRESITPYVERSYSVTGWIERRIDRRLRLSAGGRLERLLVTQSVQNGNFDLLEIPLYLRYSTANSLLNPTRGATLEYKVIPTVNIQSAFHYYLFQEISQSVYWSLTEKERVVFAQIVTFGTILSDSLNDIPVPKRFLGGSEQELRGYKYRTVSPLADCCCPEGGRSALYYTAEMRFRVAESLGLVPFFDLGNVYTTVLPKMTGRWFKSVGLGLRYFSFIGPIRVDIAFPLDRRDCLDSTYRILVSIGQTF